MVRLTYRSIYDELEELKASMDSIFQQVYEPAKQALLPAAEGEQGKVVAVQRSNLKVDVTEKDDEVIVTADMMPGVSKKDITVNLVNPRALEISCERREEKKEEKEGYYLRERRFGSMTRIVPLPKAVTEEGTTASFKNGVLEVHLKKPAKEPKGKILIE